MCLHQEVTLSEKNRIVQELLRACHWQDVIEWRGKYFLSYCDYLSRKLKWNGIYIKWDDKPQVLHEVWTFWLNFGNEKAKSIVRSLFLCSLQGCPISLPSLEWRNCFLVAFSVDRLNGRNSLLGRAECATLWRACCCIARGHAPAPAYVQCACTYVEGG